MRRKNITSVNGKNCIAPKQDVRIYCRVHVSQVKVKRDKQGVYVHLSEWKELRVLQRRT